MLAQAIIQHGYLLLFGGAMVEGDAFLLAAAFLAHRGDLRLPLVVAVAAAGTMAADQFYYHLARVKGRPLLAARAAARPKVERIRGWVERHASLLLFLSRFMYGFRVAIPVACGAVGMPAARFALVNLLGSLLWAVVFGLAGYAFGGAVETAFGHVREREAVLAVVAVVAAVGLVALVRGGRRWWATVAHPSREAVRLTGRVFLAARRGTGLLLAKPHGRVAAFVVGVGLLNLATALFHWRFAIIDLADAWLPLEVAHASRAGLFVTGGLLVAVGRGLARRKRAAWAIACGAALASVVLHLGHHASLLRSGLSAWLLWELVRHAHRFTARSDAARLRTAALAVPALAAAVVLFGVAGYQQLHLAPDAATALRMTWDAVCLHPDLASAVEAANVFGWSIAALAIVAAGYLLGALLAPVAYREHPDESSRVAGLSRAHGIDSLSSFAGEGDRSHLVVGTDAFVAYRVVRRVAVAVGDPVGDPRAIPGAISAFLSLCQRNDWVPVFYETSPRWLHEYEQAGLRSLKVGEEAILPLSSFTLAGGKAAKLRQNLSRVEREAPGITVQEYRQGARDPEIDEQLEDISAAWLRTKGIGEMGFNLGVFSVDDLRDKRTMVARTPDGTIWAFLTWRPYRGGRALLLDAMRRRPDAPPFVVDLLVVRSAQQFKDEGLEALSLATAPLANVDESAEASAYDRGVRLIFDHFSAVYGYRSLFQFKKKFNPAWEGRYLVFPRPDLLPRIAYALAAVHLEGGVAAEIRRFVAARFAAPGASSPPAAARPETARAGARS